MKAMPAISPFTSAAELAFDQRPQVRIDRASDTNNGRVAAMLMLPRSMTGLMP